MVTIPTAIAKIPRIELAMVSLKDEGDEVDEMDFLTRLPLREVDACGAIVLARLMWGCLECLTIVVQGLATYFVKGSPTSYIFRYNNKATQLYLILGRI